MVRFFFFRIPMCRTERHFRGADMRGYGKTVLAVLFLSLLLPSIAIGKAASDTDRRQMSVDVATYLHDPYHVDNDHPRAFGGSTKIEIGAVDVEEQTFHVQGLEHYDRYALADWRSRDGKHWGQVSFYYTCDHWGLSAITIGHRMTLAQLLGMPEERTTTAAKLIAELPNLEQQRFAFIPPSQPENGC
jgi:hypothetical protein